MVEVVGKSVGAGTNNFLFIYVCETILIYVSPMQSKTMPLNVAIARYRLFTIMHRI